MKQIKYISLGEKLLFWFNVDIQNIFIFSLQQKELRFGISIHLKSALCLEHNVASQENLFVILFQQLFISQRFPIPYS